MPAPKLDEGIELEVTDLAGPTRTIRRYAAPPVRIGRHRRNDLVVRRPFVSRWHGVIWFTDECIQYADLGSTNGTRVGRRTLARDKPVSLGDAGVLRIGELCLSIKRRGAPVRRRIELYPDRVKAALWACARVAVERTGPPDDELTKQIVQHWLSQSCHETMVKAVRTSLGSSMSSASVVDLFQRVRIA